MSILSLPFERLAARSSVLGCTTPRLFTPPAVEGLPGPCGCGCALMPSSSLGFEAVDFAERVLEVRLMPWQRWLLIHMLELREDGRYRFRTVLCLVGRQSGKTTLMSVLALWRMLVDGAEMILGTSTNLDYAKMAWEKCVQHAENDRWLAEEFALTGRRQAVRRANGETTLTAVNGAQYKIGTADRKGGRSLSVDLLLLDELREHKSWDAWSASSKTTNARTKGMKVAITNQGDRTSVVLNHLRAIALAGIGVDVPLEPNEDGEVLAVEPDDSLMIAEWSAPDGCELDDRTGWAQATPALGYTVEESTLASDLRTDPPDVFRTEVLCQRVDTLDAVIDAEAWAACLDALGTMDGVRDRVALCLDVSIDLQHVTLVAAAVLPDGRARVDVVAAWDGPGCVEAARQALPTWRARVKPKVLGWFPGGPSAALSPDLKDKRGVQGLTGGEVLAACQGLATDVTARRVIHNGDPLLAAQLTAAGKLNTGDGWRFIRRGGPTVDAAYATAGAVLLARTLPASLGKPRIVMPRAV